MMKKMKTGVEIKACENGFLVNNTKLIVDDQAEKILSEYFFFDYWEDKEICASQGELEKNATFMRSVIEEPGPFGSCIGRFSYFTDAKFAAGYLKYIMLGTLACDLLAAKDDECFELQDVDKILETACQSDNDTCEIVEMVHYIISLCNCVFVEESPAKQREYLLQAADEFNRCCESSIYKKTDRYYRFILFSDSEKVQSEMSKSLYIPEEKQRFEDAFSKDVWTTEDKNIIQGVMDSIV